MERAKANLPVQEIDCPHCSSKVTVYETVNLGDRRLFEGRCATCGRNVTSYREAR
jgi:DNA-directed RNA polymerase subunit RPC12/RpoP